MPEVQIIIVDSCAHVHNKHHSHETPAIASVEVVGSNCDNDTLLEYIQWRNLGEIIDAASDGGGSLYSALGYDEDIKEISDDGLEDLPLDDTVRHQIKPMLFKMDYCATW